MSVLCTYEVSRPYGHRSFSKLCSSAPAGEVRRPFPMRLPGARLLDPVVHGPNISKITGWLAVGLCEVGVL